MGTDMWIQLAIVTLTLTLFYIITHTFPHKTLTKLRTKSRASTQANTHFISGAKLLSRAQTTRNKSTSFSLAEKALSEADKALLINSKDPASHILRALSLALLGRRPAALKSLDLALSSRALSEYLDRGWILDCFIQGETGLVNCLHLIEAEPRYVPKRAT